LKEVEMLRLLTEAGMTQNSINNLVGPKVVNYVATFDNVGNQIITPIDASGKAVGATLQGTIYTAVINFAISASDSSGAQDIMIGKYGTNTIAGFDGNDHIEGRGDIDLLVGGKGDDTLNIEFRGYC
jgi:hypothetical protein